MPHVFDLLRLVPSDLHAFLAHMADRETTRRACEAGRVEPLGIYCVDGLWRAVVRITTLGDGNRRIYAAWVENIEGGVWRSMTLTASDVPESWSRVRGWPPPKLPPTWTPEATAPPAGASPGASPGSASL